jgi:hypothetical protein
VDGGDVVVDGHREVRPGDVVAIQPNERLDFPDGAVLYVEKVHGPAEPRNFRSDKVWVTVFVYNTVTGEWNPDPLPVTMSKYQQLAEWTPETREEREQRLRQARLKRKGRRWWRRRKGRTSARGTYPVATGGHR